MENSVKQRLKEFIKFKNINVYRFEKMCGLSVGYVYNIRKSIQPDKIMNISNNFPDLNIEWLLTGDGEMLKKNEQKAFGSVELWKEQAEFYRELADSRLEQMLILQKRIEELNKRILFLSEKQG